MSQTCEYRDAWDDEEGSLENSAPAPEREFFIDNLLARIHFIIVMIRWTGLAPWPLRHARVQHRNQKLSVEGYLAHKKPPLLGPYSSPAPRGLGWSWGGGAVSYGRGTPVAY